MLYEHAVARRAVLRHRARPGRVRRSQAGQGRPRRAGRQPHVHRRHRRVHRRADDQRVRGGRADRRDRVRPRGSARDARALAGVRRARLRARCWPGARGTRPSGHGVMRLIAPRGSRRAFEVRDLLERNLLPVRWYDVDTDDESAEMLEWLDIPRRGDAGARPRHRGDAQPVGGAGRAVARFARGGRRRAFRPRRPRRPGRPGLAAAVYGGSEGLRTFVAEAWAPGGQAGTSTRIENYLGFPTGISGTELTRNGDAAGAPLRRRPVELPPRRRAGRRAGGPRPGRSRRRPARTRALRRDGDGRALARAAAPRASIASAAPASTTGRWPTDAERCRDEDVIVVGGGNSAGQAAVHLATARAASASSCAAPR